MRTETEVHRQDVQVSANNIYMAIVTRSMFFSDFNVTIAIYLC